MLCRALLTAIAISYLICVLWLSGMQKEDLEVDMLRKLQRHNVDVDNLNAEDLRNECLNSKINKDNTVNEGNATTDLLENQTMLEKLESNQKTSISESDLKELIDKNISGYATLESHKNKMRASLKSLRDPSMNDQNEEYTNTVNFEVTTSAKTTTGGVNYVTDQAELERVIQFWQKFITTHQPQDFAAFTTKAPSDTRVILPEVIITNSQTKLESIIQFWPMITKTVVGRTTTLVDSTTKPNETKNKRIKTSELPKFETLMQYWQMFTTTHFVDSPVTKPSYYVTENKTFQQMKSKADEEISQSKESELMNKLLAEYIYQVQKPRTSTWKPTTATPIDFKKLSGQIERLLKLFPQEINITNRNILKNDSGSETYVKKYVPPSDFDIEKGIPQKSVIYSERTKYYDNIRKGRNGNELKSTNDVSDELSYRQTLIENNNKPNYDQAEVYRRSTITPIAKTKQNFGNKKENMVSLSQDVMKEIAENVKSIVLNDIRKEIIPTGMPSTVKIVDGTTISAIPTTGASAATKEAATSLKPNQVMKNLIQLFEQFKMLKEAAAITSNPKVVMPDNKYFTSQYQNLLNVKNGAPKLDFDSKDKPLKNSAELYSTFGIQSVPPIDTKIPIRVATVNSDQSIQKETPQMKGEIVMMQTNSEEIPPLGIPLSKPPRLIHQNIIVTTKHPIDSYNKLRESWAGMQQSGTNKDKLNFSKEESWKFNSKPWRQNIQLNSNSLMEKYGDQKEQWNQVDKPETNSKDRLSKARLFNHIAPSTLPNAKNDRLYESHSYQQRNSRFRNRQDIKRPLYSSRYEDILNSQLNGEYQEPKDSKREKKYFDKISFGTFSRHRNGERFHEKLERIDDLRGESLERKEDECCSKLKVASRKQRPLTNDKRASSYDDSHFRNFLRTQQKVNNMLERILATKTVQDGPRSVETT